MFISLRGQCLIAAKTLRDGNFYKTVVLMLEHTGQGATGLVLNRPSSVRVAHALSGHFALPDTEEVVFIGGPVEPNALLILHDAESLGGADSSPAPGVPDRSATAVYVRARRIQRTKCPVKGFVKSRQIMKLPCLISQILRRCLVDSQHDSHADVTVTVHWTAVVPALE